MKQHGTLFSATLVAVVLGALYCWTVAPTIGWLHGTVDSAPRTTATSVAENRVPCCFIREA
ncbi:MAG: hypothetical protein EPO65_02365 [Dehalococcoidia bacterium]|nr:MAG: hypothetical protein EPO65_02365 [Dehalococcoidia bacterium]